MKGPVRITVATSLVLGLACIDPFAPPADTYSFNPPVIYQAEWKAVEDCSGLVGDFNRIRWFGVPETPFRCGDALCSGEWHAPHDIYIAQVFINDSGSHYFTVRHEMLHDLLGGGADHPPVFDRCGLIDRALRDGAIGPFPIQGSEGLQAAPAPRAGS